MWKSDSLVVLNHLRGCDDYTMVRFIVFNLSLAPLAIAGQCGLSQYGKVYVQYVPQVLAKTGQA